MKYEVVKTYEVLAESESKAKEILTKLEEKNLQSLFLKSESTTVAQPDQRRIWKLW